MESTSVSERDLNHDRLEQKLLSSPGHGMPDAADTEQEESDEGREEHDANDISFSHFSIDRWLHKVPGGYLKDTEFGHRPGLPIPPEVAEQGLLRQVYLVDIALAITAERASTRVASGLAHLADDEAAMIFFSSQTLDEARHFEAFANRFRELGLPDETRDKIASDYMWPAYRDFLDLMVEAIDAKDFETSMVGLNIILEGMAFPLYDYEMRYWSPFDPALADIIQGAFRDEVRHVGFGEKRLQHRLKGDPGARNRVQKKVNDLGRKMREAFAQFLKFFIGFYDLAVRDYMDRVGDVEIIPGRRLIETPAEDQVLWLEKQIMRGHQKRLQRIGIDYEA